MVTTIQFQDFLNCRGRPSVHALFMDRFVKLVVSVRVWNMRLKSPFESINELCTVSDEAFALLALENGWETWVDTLRLAGGKFQRQKKTEKGEKRPVPESPIPLKYTTHKSNNKTNFHQWTNAGVEKFNEYYDLVKHRRELHEEVDQEWLEQQTKDNDTPQRENSIDISICRQDW